MKYCSHCGNQLPDEAAFCSRCGCAVDSIKKVDNKAQQKPFDLSTGRKVSLILNSILLPGVGLVFGIVFLSKRNKTQKTKNIAILAIVLSGIMMLIGYILLMAYLA